MSFSLPAVLACTFFYSALYLIYYYFAQYNHTLLIVSAIVLLILAWGLHLMLMNVGNEALMILCLLDSILGIH